MARAGSREGHGDQTPADRRNVQIEGGQEQRNVSGWVDWRQFATVMDAAGTQLSREEMETLPGLCIRIVCTPAGVLALINVTCLLHMISLLMGLILHCALITINNYYF